MTSGHDRRKASRVRFIHPVTYSVTKGRRQSPSSSGKTFDLSPGGVRLEAQTRLLVGDVLDLEIAAGEILLRASARVVHVTPSAPGRGLEVGAEFIRLDDEADATIRSLIALALDQKA